MHADLRRWRMLIEAEDANNAARLKRAAALGFDINHVFYHATTQDFSAFYLRYAGASNTVGTTEPAIFLTDDPHTANSYLPTQYYAEYLGDWTPETYKAT